MSLVMKFQIRYWNWKVLSQGREEKTTYSGLKSVRIATEPCKADSKFCSNCRMVLCYDAYNETVDAKEEKESQVKELQQKYEKDMKDMREDMEIKFQKILDKIEIKEAS